MNSLHLDESSVILASQSRYKADLLSKITKNFRCIAANIDETPSSSESAHELASRLAYEKASKISSMQPEAWVLGCDQVALLKEKGNLRLLNKPGTFEKAFEQLTRCSGKRVEFHTACCLVNTEKSIEERFSDSFELEFKVLSRTLIERYLAIDEPYDCAGSIKSEGAGVVLIEKYLGNDPNTLVGLPLIKLVALFDKHDIPYID